MQKGSDLLLHRLAGLESIDVLANVDRIDVDKVPVTERPKVILDD